jgi:hypothetical protein
MQRADFDRILRRAGRTVTVTRGADTVSVVMASEVGRGDDVLLQDATQDDDLVTFSNTDFAASALVKPDRHDRVTDIDGRVYAIRRVRNMRGVAGELWGFKALVRGSE